MHRKQSIADQMNTVDRLAGGILAFGALNWGLVGATKLDAIRATLGRSAGARAAYGLIGASAVYALARGRQLQSR